MFATMYAQPRQGNNAFYSAPAGSYTPRSTQLDAECNPFHFSYGTQSPTVMGTASLQAPGLDLNQVYKTIWIGGQSAIIARELSARGIGAVVNTADELTLPGGAVNWNELRSHGIRVLHTPWRDLTAQKLYPFSPQTEEALSFISNLVANNQHVLVNCQMGISRSTSLVLAYMIAREGFGLDEALGIIRSKRSKVSPNLGFLSQLSTLEGHARKAHGHQSNGHHHHSHNAQHAAPHHGAQNQQQINVQHPQPSPQSQHMVQHTQNSVQNQQHSLQIVVQHPQNAPIQNHHALQFPQNGNVAHHPQPQHPQQTGQSQNVGQYSQNVIQHPQHPQQVSHPQGVGQYSPQVVQHPQNAVQYPQYQQQAGQYTQHPQPQQAVQYTQHPQPQQAAHHPNQQAKGRATPQPIITYDAHSHGYTHLPKSETQHIHINQLHSPTHIIPAGRSSFGQASATPAPSSPQAVQGRPSIGVAPSVDSRALVVVPASPTQPSSPRRQTRSLTYDKTAIPVKAGSAIPDQARTVVNPLVEYMGFPRFQDGSVLSQYQQLQFPGAYQHIQQLPTYQPKQQPHQSYDSYSQNIFQSYQPPRVSQTPQQKVPAYGQPLNYSTQGNQNPFFSVYAGYRGAEPGPGAPRRKSFGAEQITPQPSARRASIDPGFAYSF